jgi:hypothetical protein
MSAAVHWLRGTTVQDEETVLTALSAICGGLSYEVMPAGKYLYARRVRSVEGLTVLSEPYDPVTMPPVCVEVPGAACEFLGAARLQGIASMLSLTRVDFAWDEVPFTVADARSWVAAGNMRTRLGRATGHEQLGFVRPGKDGNTVTLGSRQGTAQLVVYDRRGPVRAEMRLYGERAASPQVAELLGSPVASWSAGFLGLLRGVVDFVDRREAVRGEDCPLLPEWAAFVEDAPRVVVKLGGNAAPSLERARAWVMTQVSKTLYMLALAGVGAEKALKWGHERMTPSDWMRVGAWQESAGFGLSPG